MTPHILLVASTTGYQTRVFEDAARRLGYRLTLATDRCHVLNDPWGDGAIPLRFEAPAASLGELRALTPRPTGVLAVGDRPACVAAYAAQMLGLPHSAPRAVELTRNKYEARLRYRAAGLPVPEFYRISTEAHPRMPADAATYPCVLKPLGLSGSRGVIRADNPAEFIAAFQRIRALLARPDIRAHRDESSEWIQVERYIEGSEYALEGLLENGVLRVLTIFDKPEPLEGPFFEETIYTTPSRAPLRVQHAIRETVEAGARALGLDHGPIHAEVRQNSLAVWLLELAARPIGGLCGKALRFEGEVSLEEFLLRWAAGEDVSRIWLESGASGVMMIPIPKSGLYKNVTGVDEAGAVPGITSVMITAKEGQALLRLPEGSSYLGFLFARAETPSQVEAALREAHGRLEFEVVTELAISSST